MSATFAAAFPSVICSCTNSFVLSIALPMLSVMLSTPRVTLPTASAATLPASENSKFIANFIALPKAGNSSSIPSTRFVRFSFIASPKSIAACFGFSNTDIILSPKSANKSRRLPVKAPITLIIFANLFCPSSLAVNALPTAAIAKAKAPIPVAAIANFKLLKDFITLPIVPLNFPNLAPNPPVKESTPLKSAPKLLVELEAFFIEASVFLI